MLIDSALVAHSPQISDVSEDMSSAVLCHRQIWLAQTTLPFGANWWIYQYQALMSFIQILRKCWTDLNFPLHWGRMFTGLAGILQPLNRFETPQRLQWPAWYWHDMGGPAGVQEHHFHVNSKILTSLPRRVVHGNSCSTSVAYHIIHQGGTKSLRCAVSSWLSSYRLRHGHVQHLWEKLRKTQTIFYSFNWIKARQPVQTGVVSWLFQHFVKGQWPAIRPTSFNKNVS